MNTPKLQVIGKVRDIIDETKVIFSKDHYTIFDIGKVKGSEKRQLLVEKGQSMADFMSLFDEELIPTIKQPFISITFDQAKSYEVGTNIMPTYSVTFNPGSYEYDESTGVTLETLKVTDSSGNERTTQNGTFPSLQITDGIIYTLMAEVSYTEGTIPHTNQGNEYEAGKIAAGSTFLVSGTPSGYRNTFYGTKATKDTLDSTAIRALTKSGKALANTSKFDVTIPVGALRVVIAYPATLRDLTSVVDVNGMNTNIVGSFVKSTLSVEGANSYTAIPYKVFVLDYAEATTKENTYKVTI